MFSPKKELEYYFSFIDLTDQEVAELENSINTGLTHAEDRAKLLAHYYCRLAKLPIPKNAKLQKLRLSHLLWFIENCPDHVILGLPFGFLDRNTDQISFDVALQAWEQSFVKHPKEPRFLLNYAGFLFFDSEHRAQALDILELAKKLHPKNRLVQSSFKRIMKELDDAKARVT